MINRVLGFFLLVWPVFAAEPVAPPKLAVVIAVDQMRADYLGRFRPYFGEGGFKRLLEGGADFQSAHYRHAIAHTGPGHALMLSGVHANVHGIIGNQWLDRETWEVVNCVEDPASPLVGIQPGELGPAQAARPEKTGRSPRNFLASTVGDQLKLRYGARAKVFTASNKDRAAILLGGKLADAAYWVENGTFITSRYYRNELPAWVGAFNAERRAEAAFGKTWDRLLAPAIYDAVQGPDDAAGELDKYGLTRTFPKKITGGEARPGAAFHAAYELSPYSTEALGEFVQRAVVEEQLGRHDGATDLLGVSFSQIDVVGHGYGPDSHEIMDAMLRLDRVLAALLDRIDREVGLANCAIVLTADHGVAPLPERVQALRPAIPAGRVEVKALDAAGKKALEAAFGVLADQEPWFTRETYAYYLRPAVLAAKKITASEAAKVLKAGLRAVPGVAEAFTRDELLAAEPAGDSVLAMSRRSYHVTSGQDVVIVLRPYFMIMPAVGSTHGMPYDYDTHVPLVWWGAGAPRGVQAEPVGMEDLAPTLAAWLQVPAPPQAMGRRLW